MAKKSTLRRLLSVAWDRDAARRLQTEAEDSLEKAGKLGADALEEELKKGGSKGARSLTSALQREYRLRMAQARQQFADEAIDEKAFRREGEKAAEEFNKGLSGGIRKLQASQGGLTQAQYAGLASRYKTVPGAGSTAAGGGLLAAGRGLLGPLAGIFTVTEAISEGTRSIEVADQYESALRKLGGTAKLAGVDFDTLAASAAATKAEFELSDPLANDLIGTMTRLAAQAGDTAQAGTALTAWMDLAAAAGLDAQSALEALEVTFRGQDEGLNKLGLANPAEIYKKWGAGADDASKRQAILNEIVAEGSKATGEYTRFLESNQGAAQKSAVEIDNYRKRIGESLQPIREIGRVLREVLFANLLAVSTVVGTLVGWAGKTFTFTFEAITKPGEVWRRLWEGSEDPGPILRDATPDIVSAAAVARADGTAVDALGRPYRTPEQRRQDDADRQKLRDEEARAREEAAEAARQAAAEAEAARVRDLNQLVEGANLRILTQAETAKLVAIEAEHRAALERGNLSLVERLRLTREQAQVAGALGLDRMDRLGAPSIIEPERESGLDLDPLALPNDTQGRHIASAEYWQQVTDAARDAATQVASVWQDTFALMMDEGATFGNFFEGVGRGAAGALAGVLAEYARGEAAKHFAEAIGAAAYALGFTAHGNFASASAAAASAAEHAAAGTAFAALAGAAAAGQGAMRNRAPGSTYDQGLSRVERMEFDAQPITIYVDPFNPANPVHTRQIGKAVRLEVRLDGKSALTGGR